MLDKRIGAFLLMMLVACQPQNAPLSTTPSIPKEDVAEIPVKDKLEKSAHFGISPREQISASSTD